MYNQLYVDYSDVANGWFDIWSSTMDYGIGIAPTFNFLFATNSPSSVKGSSAPWQRFYKGIIKANDVIGNLPTVEMRLKEAAIFQNVCFCVAGGITG